MARQKFPCKNHSARLTLRRCFLCKEYICPECQINRAHHRFCGIYCYFRYILFQYFSVTKIKKTHIVLISIFVFIQLLTILIVWTIVENKTSQINQAEIINPKVQLEDSTAFFSMDTLTRPFPYKLEFFGQSDEQTLLALWHNGKIVQSKIAKENKYQFKPVIMEIGNNTFKILRIAPSGKTIFVDSLFVDFYSQRISQLVKSVSRITTKEKVLSLTFDAGSISNGAENILNILKENEIHTTFFLTGRFIRKNIDLTAEIIENKHEIGNHTYSHPHFTEFEDTWKHTTLPNMSRDIVQQELLAMDSVLYANFNKRSKPFWRAPFGEYNKEILQWAGELGFRHIRWSRHGDTMDWVREEDSALYRSSEQIYENILNMESTGKLKGAILLMHLGTDRKSDFPYLMLPKLIKYLKEKNYRFLSISEMLDLKNLKN